MFSVYDLLVLSQIPNVGLSRLRALINKFGDPQSIRKASVREIASLDGFGRRLASHIGYFFRHQTYDEAKRYAENQLSRLNKVNGQVVTLWDPGYPDLLRKIYDPPLYLFLRGGFDESRDRHSLAIVGTRSPSEYGKTMAERFAHELVRLGMTVVSGLARGVDTIVHSSTVKADGRTLAVIGSGIDTIYPPENKGLAERITLEGALISEYDMGAKPDAVNFPRRNRVISGLSVGTLIIETDLTGGAMITASTALDQNREVFALPGPITSRKSRGCHALIKTGRAKLIESIDDIVEELATKLRPLLATKQENRQVSASLTPSERTIAGLLSETPLHIDHIADHAGLSVSEVLVSLLSLEFKGEVRQLAGKMFARI